jgi:hypothetical protein
MFKYQLILTSSFCLQQQSVLTFGFKANYKLFQKQNLPSYDFTQS